MNLHILFVLVEKDGEKNHRRVVHRNLWGYGKDTLRTAEAFEQELSDEEDAKQDSK